ncbi:larval cuticle protein A3A-like [Condylostylus longicornis]|uniref:larval cuticle protein A3A-like n=1 Tax=Condylostylus longicornis TaxID=2530218 RepID=UPI00244DC4A5|nr:larval cuticle protein A3A-like [Condylostylus longicornis]
MAFKFIVFVGLLAVANAVPVLPAVSYAAGPAPLAYAAPAYAGPAYAKVAAPAVYAAPAIAKVAAPIAVAKVAQPEPYDPNPQYTFAYDIQDSLTGDSKSQHETRNGDVVQGSYSLTEPDGTRRTVDYVADPVSGFNAVVRKEPLVQKAVVAAPAIAKVAAPIYAAPIAKVAAPVYAAPAIAKVAAAPFYAHHPVAAAPVVAHHGYYH